VDKLDVWIGSLAQRFERVLIASCREQVRGMFSFLFFVIVRDTDGVDRSSEPLCRFASDLTIHLRKVGLSDTLACVLACVL